MPPVVRADFPERVEQGFHHRDQKEYECADKPQRNEAVAVHTLSFFICHFHASFQLPSST